MPLAEISPNIQRDARPDGSKQQDVAVTTSTTSLRSSAVQSMLKTTTELGDTGPFAVRPPRIPRSGSRLQSTRFRSGSFDTSLPPSSATKHLLTKDIFTVGMVHDRFPHHLACQAVRRFIHRHSIRDYGPKEQVIVTDPQVSVP
ncbi:hypothetical protein EDD37DRAFT_378104 [Exophiala viscosa]|uniref:uncharacterized protein n=1 Tax=Exophiala viscosa TaxID=2486360 RepID=UPI002193D401|nr:hypothetical protein EDD37DRAFT_378104 [Exophiala viscosa]